MKHGDLIWGLVFLGITAFLIIPSTHEVFVATTNAHPYFMGFVKFAVMASMGELLALRLISGKWNKTSGMQYKAIIWGIVGMLIVLMFTVFSGGVAAAEKAGLLYKFDGVLGTVLDAIYISVIINLTFGPMFMAAHRISDTYIDLRAEGQKTSVADVVSKTDWQGFIKFVIRKTIPYFWIPAHTITFLLPAQYRVLWAAYLSIALGIILSYARRKKVQ
ncbi:Mpv17/PMP22 family protein [Anaerobacterium chartisolvens]|uniref:Mpv17/PMP22 family protein n=1 Tax=Anaerobacterium chartisolvens TaxID=1297424 RepID=A0A369AP17_9FIRM|nr:Mpv17/PMP22 family protein [Anaerobacterium chartisolvens]RCX09937.1 Mpv17/PMP22 family protein [Anaerobacterium chartisolvens]